MKLKAQQWPHHLARAEPAPVYLIYGEEILLVQEAADALIATVKQQGFTEINTQVIDAQFDWSEAWAGEQSLSLFSSRKLVRLLFYSADLITDAVATHLTNWLQICGQDHILVLQVMAKIDQKHQKKAWFRTLDQQGVILALWSLSRYQLPAWISERSKKLGLQLTKAAAQLLADRTEGHLLATAQELEKLAILITGSCDVEQVAAASALCCRFDVFGLTDACLSGEADRAIRILCSLREEGIEPVLVLWALNREWQQLIRLINSPQAQWQSLGVWSYRQPLYTKALKRLSSEIMEQGLEQIALLDRCVKTQESKWRWLGLQHLALTFCGRPLGAADYFWQYQRSWESVIGS